MEDENSSLPEIWEGIGLVFAFLLAVFILAYAAFDTWSDWGPNGPTSPWTSLPMTLLAFCGFTQLLYLVPAYLFLRKRRKAQAAKGVVLGAAFVLALNLLFFFLGPH